MLHALDKYSRRFVQLLLWKGQAFILFSLIIGDHPRRAADATVAIFSPCIVCKLQYTISDYSQAIAEEFL